MSNYLMYIFLLISINVSAQSLTLKNLIENITIRNVELSNSQLEKQKALIFSKNFKELPKTNIELQAGNIQNPFVHDYALGVKQSLQNPSYYKSIQDSYGLKSEYYDLNKVQISKNLKKQIAEIYYEYVFQTQQLSIYENSVSKINKIYEVVEKKYKSGEADLKELNDLNLKKLIFENKLIEIKNEIESYKQKLLVWSGNDMDSQILVDTVYIPILKSEANIDMKLADWQIKEQENSIKIVKNQAKPGFTLGLINQSMMGSYQQFIALAGIDIPVFNNGLKKKIEAKNIDVKISQQYKLGLKQMQDLELRDLNIKIKNYDYQIHAIQDKIIPLLEKNTEITLDKYLGGDAEYHNIFDSLYELINTKERVINYKKMRVLAMVQIDYINE